MCRLIFLLFIYLSFSQYTIGQRFYMEAGLLSSSFQKASINKSISVVDQTNAKAIVRPSFFLKYQQRIKRHFFFEFGLGYEGRGSIFENKSMPFAHSIYERTINLHYITGVGSLLYRFNSGAKNRFIDFGLGPYISHLYYGVEEGKSLRYSFVNGEYESLPILNRINISGKSSNQTFPTSFLPIDIGGNLSARYTINRFRLSLQYGFGLKELFTNGRFYDREYRNASIGFLFSYQLNNIK